ncbi:MAG TPA: DUF3099 domain-containing protein [Actinocrinis sp.]
MQFAAQDRDDGPEPRAQYHGAAGRVYGITTAETSHSDDLARRQKQYLLTMLFRIVVIIVVVLVPGIGWPVKILLMALGAVIPFFAVVRANGPSRRSDDPTNMLIGAPQGRQLNEGREGLPQGDGTIAGEAWENDEAADDEAPDDEVSDDGALDEDDRDGADLAGD